MRIDKRGRTAASSADGSIQGGWAVKQTINRIMVKLRQRSGSGRTLVAGDRHRGDSSILGPGLGAATTGHTVFNDRPLRLRTFTLAEPDVPTLEHPATIPGGAFKIRIAKRSGAHRDAKTLVRDKYATRGYAVPAVEGKPRSFTFIAYDEGRLVGTVTVGTDSSAGMFADGLYRAEIDRMRAEGWRICEFTRLAVDRNAASKRVLAGLFHTAYLFASKIRGYTHAIIEVNPRHVAFYGKELRFEVIGPERLDPRVNAPAVLLCAPFAAIADGLAKNAGKRPPHGGKRSLFHYGFAPGEEAGVLNRLTELAVQGSWAP